MNRTFSLVLLVATVILAPLHSLAAVGTQAQVILHNDEFNPKILTIEAGTTVFWTNSDMVLRTVTADDGSFSSPDLGKAYTFSYTFDVAGNYLYYSMYGGGKGGKGMSGTVVVTAPTKPAGPSVSALSPQSVLTPQVPVSPLAPTYGTAASYFPESFREIPIQTAYTVWSQNVTPAPRASVSLWNLALLRPRCFFGPYGHQCF